MGLLVIMQNKANLQKAQMSTSLYGQKDYVNELRWRLLENKPNQTQCRNSSKLIMPIKNRLELLNLDCRQTNLR